MRKQWMAAAAALMTLVGAAHAQATPTQAADTAALQRAQVKADQEMWHKAGMSFLPSSSEFGYVKETPEYRKYEQLRNGPAFQEAVARHLDGASTVVQRGTPQAQP